MGIVARLADLVIDMYEKGAIYNGCVGSVERCCSLLTPVARPCLVLLRVRVPRASHGNLICHRRVLIFSSLLTGVSFESLVEAVEAQSSEAMVGG